MVRKSYKINTYYSQNERYKYDYVSQEEIDKLYEQRLLTLLDNQCNWFVIVFYVEDERLFNELMQHLGNECILEQGYMQHLVRFRTNKKMALKVSYSRSLIKKIKSFFNSETYFPFFDDQIDCAYYQDELCLMTQVFEHQGVYILKRLNFM